MFICHSQAKGVGELISGHNWCSDVSDSGADQEETHLPNVAKAVENVAKVATVKLEEIPKGATLYDVLKLIIFGAAFLDKQEYIISLTL